MSFPKQRNWAFTILRMKMPLFVALVIGVGVVASLFTLLVRPIYSATTFLTLDAGLLKVLGEMKTPYPQATMLDFIRYEFFASHSVQQMRLPQMAKQVVEKLGLKDQFGRPLPPEYLLDPGLARLVFTNRGAGVKVEWIADTQSFTITGLSSDPQKAVQLSREYADAFLAHDAGQFNDTLLQLIERTRIQQQEVTARVAELDRELQDIRAKYKTSDPSQDVTAVAAKLYVAKGALEAEQAKEVKYNGQVKLLKEKQESFAKLMKVERVFTTNPVIDTLKSELRTLHEMLAAATVELRPDHPDYKAVEKKIKVAEGMLRKESLRRYSQDSEKENPMVDSIAQNILTMMLDHVVNESTMQFYKKLVEGYEERLMELNEAGQEALKANIKKETLNLTLKEIIKDRYRMESIIEKAVPFYRVVSSAYINKDNLSDYRYFPKRKRSVAVALLVSTFLLASFIFGREMAARKFYYGWQLDFPRDRFGCVEIPFIEFGDRSRSERNTLVYGYIQDVCSSEKDARIIRICGKEAGEGKAVLASALAGFFSKIGSSVILVDGDTVNRSLSNAMGAGKKPGLLDVLAGRAQPDETVLDKGSGIFLMPAGGRDLGDDAPLDLSLLRKTAAELSGAYPTLIYVDPPYARDYTMISDDLPPNDIILVVESGRHSVPDVEQTVGMRRFNTENAALKWIIVNKTPEIVDFLSWQDIKKFVSNPLRSLKSAI